MADNIIHLHVTDRSGKRHDIVGLTGWRLMEVIRDHAARLPALGIKAECGGALACATCHVYIDPDWTARLPVRSDDESDQLDAAFAVDEELSRLSCQIILDDSMNGLGVTLAPGSEP